MFGEAKETSFSLSDALWTCSDMFGRSAHKFSHRRILLFTREDNPHVTDVSKTQLAKTKARDLADNGITIDLMHMAPPEGAKFQLGFYQVNLINFVHSNLVLLKVETDPLDRKFIIVKGKENILRPSR